MTVVAAAGGFADDVLVVDGLVFFSDGGVEGLRAGKIAAINLTVSHFEADFETSCEQLAGWHARLGQPDSPWRLVESTADIAAARADGKVGLIMGWQNMRPIGDDLDRLALFHRLGLRIMQPTYNFRNFMGDGCLEPDDGGLSALGGRAVAAMNEIGIAIDLSHVGERTARDIVEASEKPVLITHANARAVSDNPRNKSDALIAAVAQSGGTVGVSIYGPMCWDGDPQYPPAIDDFLRHLEHIAGVAGVGHVAIGTDLPAVAELDAVAHITEQTAKRYPAMIGAYAAAFGNDVRKRYLTGCSSHAELVHVVAALEQKGWPEADVRGLLGENLVRALATIWGD